MIFAPVFFFLSFLQPSFSRPAPTAPVFRLHLPSEPKNFDPHQQKNSSASYLLFNLFRNVYVFDDERGLVPELGESCERSADRRQLTCRLKKNLKWSDGTPLTARDFADSYKKILDPRTGSPRADLLFPVKNAEAVYRGQKKPSELGVQVLNDRSWRFEFQDRAPDFEYNLALSATAPTREIPVDPVKMVVSGPFRIQSIEKGRRLRLTSNSYFTRGAKDRPDVEFVFVEDDGTALRLYEKNELDFLRRLPTIYIPRYKGTPEFHWLPVTRLDYLGFSPKWRDREDVRRALALALDYLELKKMFAAEGPPPGCPGLPESWAAGPWPCIHFDAAGARQAAASAKPGTLRLTYSTQGGEDHRRGAEWLQEQWRKNAALTVRVQGLENKLFLADLKNSPPDLFRKGLAPDRPTCYAALEKFLDPHSGHFISFPDARFSDLVKKLGNTDKETEKKELCSAAVRILVERHHLIPTGRIHFSILIKTKFTGYRLNQMNQLDLGELRVK